MPKKRGIILEQNTDSVVAFRGAGNMELTMPW
jgi:hypothetical protein